MNSAKVELLKLATQLVLKYGEDWAAHKPREHLNEAKVLPAPFEGHQSRLKLIQDTYLELAAMLEDE